MCTRTFARLVGQFFAGPFPIRRRSLFLWRARNSPRFRSRRSMSRRAADAFGITQQAVAQILTKIGTSAETCKDFAPPLYGIWSKLTQDTAVVPARARPMSALDTFVDTVVPSFTCWTAIEPLVPTVVPTPPSYGAARPVPRIAPRSQRSPEKPSRATGWTLHPHSCSSLTSLDRPP